MLRGFSRWMESPRRGALWLSCALALGACDAGTAEEDRQLEDEALAAQLACGDGGVEDGGTTPDGGQPGGATDYKKPGPLGYVIEKNVGGTFRNANVTDDTFLCNLFIGLIGNSTNGEVNTELTSYPADMNRQLYTLYRPERFEPGKKYPVIT